MSFQLKLIDEVIMKNWEVKIPKEEKCFLYDFKTLGILPEQFVETIAGQKAMVFERQISDRISTASSRCPWCEYTSVKRKGRKKIARDPSEPRIKLQDHIYLHNKNIVSYQVYKFCEELYRIRLQSVRDGYHFATGFLVKHDCPFCITPVAEGREGKCAVPSSTRNRVMSLEKLGYPVDHLIKNRLFEWSIFGVMVLISA
jgi:hypothetical protein